MNDETATNGTSAACGASGLSGELGRPIELITWRDCVSLGGWQYLSDMKGWAGRVISTVGMIVEETEDDIVLAMSSGYASAGELLCNWMSIPKSVIIWRVVLRSN